jgi:hypothetical protein
MLMQQVATAAAAGAPLTQQQQTDTWAAMLKQRQDRLEEVKQRIEIAQSLYGLVPNCVICHIIGSNTAMFLQFITHKHVYSYVFLCVLILYDALMLCKLQQQQ